VIPADEDPDNVSISNLRVVPEISKADLPKRRSNLTVELIRKLFSYEGGRLFWAIQCHGTHIRFGMEAGTINSYGYRVIVIGGKAYKAHQIAYVLYHGEWLTEGEIDHGNLNKSDNRIENIREATRSQNCANKSFKKTNSTGIRGVHKCKKSGRYHVYVGQKYLSSHVDIDQAILARRTAAQERYGEFARH
jgi:hypothetical protein